MSDQSAEASVRIEPLPSTGGGMFANVVARHRFADGSSTISKRVGNPEDAEREVAALTDTHWLAALPEGLRVPRVHSALQHRDALVLELEDLGECTPLSAGRHVEAAELLTRWSVRATYQPAWGANDALRSEYERLTRPGLALLEATAVVASHQSANDHTANDHAAKSDVVTDDAAIDNSVRASLSRLADRAGSDLQFLDVAPHGPAHMDAFSRNIIECVDGTLGFVDWASAGWAPIGTDAATMFALGLGYLDVDARHIGRFRSELLSAVVAAAVECDDLPERTAAHAFDAVARLRCLAMLSNALPMLERGDPSVSAIVGRPLDVIGHAWATIAEFLADT